MSQEEKASTAVGAAIPPEAVAEPDAARNAKNADKSASVSFKGSTMSEKREEVSRFTATMTGTLPTLSGEDPKAEADKLLEYGERVQQQMDFFGDGHPQSGQLAVSYAQACNIVARATLSKNLYRTSKKLLDGALHFLRLNHSVMFCEEHNRALAETFSNLGCLECKREKLDSSLSFFRKAIAIEGSMEWEDGHASTLISACSTLSLLQRHKEAAECAKLAVDMLAQSPNIDASEVGSETGDDIGAADLMPIALNNLGLEMLYLKNTTLATEAYEKALELAQERWGEEDDRSQGIKAALEDLRNGVELGKYSVGDKVGVGPLKKVEKTQIRARIKPPKSKSGLGLYMPKSLKVMSQYAERISPVERTQDKQAGFTSPRFWATKDGMQPRRVSPFNKDTRQIGLEMARKGGAAQFPSYVQRTRWGEQRVQWSDLPDADLSRIDGSVHSRTRLFSSAASNDQLNAVAKIHGSRRSIRSRYPTNFEVYKQAQTLRSTYLSAEDSAEPEPELDDDAEIFSLAYDHDD